MKYATALMLAATLFFTMGAAKNGKVSATQPSAAERPGTSVKHLMTFDKATLAQLCHNLYAVVAQKHATIERLVDLVHKQQAELSTLRAENAKLKVQITKLKAGQAGTGAPADKIKKAIAEHRLANGMTVAEAEKALGEKLTLIADRSEGPTYRVSVQDKARPNPNTGAIYTGTDYTISIQNGVISYWSSRRYFIGTDGLTHWVENHS